jgi:hypothetical protein
LVGTNDQFKEFLVGDNRTWKVVLKVGLDVKFTGYITPDFVTINDISGPTVQTFTAVDGLKGFDAIRAIPQLYAPAVRNLAYANLIGALNQSYVDFRNVNMACQVHESRMYEIENVFEQFIIPEVSLYPEGQPQYLNGSQILNNQVFISEMLES